MIRKVIRSILTIMGIMLGYVLANSILSIEGISQIDAIRENLALAISSCIIFSLLIGLIFYFISPLLIRWLFNFMEYIEKYTQKMAMIDIVLGAIGGIVGLLIGVLIGTLFASISEFFAILSIIFSLGLAIICGDIAVKKKEEIIAFFTGLNRKNNSKERKSKKNANMGGVPKVLDTSVIIDGRILDICKTGFVEGPLIIPQFVLDELRHISDSADDLKRTKGRRGLDILNEIQKDLPIEVQISDMDFPDIAEVDSKLLKLSQVLNGKVVTNDFNLNKVAEFQGVSVLNINDLANAIKPVLLPGEELKLQIIKEGKENNQGIGYLDDGTLIVVENGKKYIGEFIDASVTSVLQTSAGRMIFATRKS